MSEGDSSSSCVFQKRFELSPGISEVFVAEEACDFCTAGVAEDGPGATGGSSSVKKFSQNSLPNMSVRQLLGGPQKTALSVTHGGHTKSIILAGIAIPRITGTLRLGLAQRRNRGRGSSYPAIQCPNALLDPIA